MEETQYEETPIDVEMMHERASIEEKARAFDILLKHFQTQIGQEWRDNETRMHTALLMALADAPLEYGVDYGFWDLTAEDLNWDDA